MLNGKDICGINIDEVSVDTSFRKTVIRGIVPTNTLVKSA